MEGVDVENGSAIARPEADAATAAKEAAKQVVAAMSRRVRGIDKATDEWQPITYLKRQRGGEGDALYVKARAMEAAKYATRHAVVREEGGDERRSPRLAEAHVAAA